MFPEEQNYFFFHTMHSFRDRDRGQYLPLLKHRILKNRLLRNHGYIIEWIYHTQGLMQFFRWGVMQYVRHWTLEPPSLYYKNC